MTFRAIDIAAFLLLSLPLTSAAQSALYANDVSIILESAGALFVQGDASFSGAATIANRGQISLTGNWDNSASSLFLEDSGEVVFTGSALQTINGTTGFYKLEVNNSAGVTIQSGKSAVKHSLSLTAGTLTTNDSLYLQSDSTRTARVEEVTGGDASGDFIVERYIGPSGNGWTLMSIPVQNATLQQWYGDFATTGFTGAEFPSFSFTSIYYYNESSSGPAENGFEAPTNITNAVSDGQGIWAYIGPLPATAEVKGEINIGSVNFPITYTDDAAEDADQDGWNLVGNPYPCSIDWDASSGWTKTNVNDAIYIWDTEQNQYRSYVGGVGTNGGAATIAPSQGFYVHTSASSPVLSATESVKISGDAPFVRTTQDQPHVLRILTSAYNFSDELILRFQEGATSGFDPKFDAYKAMPITGYAPSISTSIGGEQYAINSIDHEIVHEGIDVHVFPGWPGIHQFTISDIPSVPEYYCMYLEDLLLGDEHPLDSGYTFSAFVDTGAASLAPRFRIHIYQPLSMHVQLPTCHDDANGSVHLSPNGLRPWHVQWLDAEGLALFNDTIDGQGTIDQLSSGQYTAIVDDGAGCGVSAIPVTIESRDSMWVRTTISPAYADGQLGSVTVFPHGGVAPHEVLWDEPIAQVGSSLLNIPSGTYSMQIIDSVGCHIEHVVLVPLFAGQVTGIKSLSLSNGVYPNPSHGVVNLKFGVSGPFQIVVHDQLGRIVYHEKRLGPEVSLDLSNLPAGGYFLLLQSENQPNLSLPLILH